MKSLSASIGDRIYSLRTNRKPKMSREKLAEKAGVDPATIYRWERGKSFPEGKNIEALARALGVTPGELLGMNSSSKPIELREPSEPYTRMSDLTKSDKILEALDRINKRLPSETSQLEIERLTCQVEEQKAEVERLKAENQTLKRILVRLPESVKKWDSYPEALQLAAELLLTGKREFAEKLSKFDLPGVRMLASAAKSLQKIAK